MPTISKPKKDKISEQILHFLFSLSPESKFTAEIAESIARDEEFTKVLLVDLQKNNLIVEVNKNNKGVQYQKRQRWRLSNEAYEAYKRQQSSSTSNISINADNFD